jgi:photosystem II stability/assembly factor-like uncharacterized protein
MRQTPISFRPWRTAVLLALAAGAGVLAAQTDSAPSNAGATLDPSRQTAEIVPLADKSLILDMADGANRAIAVGERGHILVSESRRDWRQVENVPTRSTLTAVATVGELAWAVGHDGVILHSADGGLTWQSQRAQPYDPNNVDDLHNGTPLLDVLFTDAQNGMAIGAYSQMLKTADGGTTWTAFDFVGAIDATIAAQGAVVTDDTLVDEPVDTPAAAGDDADEAAAAEASPDDESWTFSEEDLALDDETDPHLNAIARTGDGSFFIVGERGVAFRSTDGGERWQRINLPYQGSMFGVLGYEGRQVLAFGLRGHVFESNDLGDHWREIDSGTELSLMGGAGWAGGGAALVGANGVVLTRTAAGANLLRHTHPDGAVLAAVLPLPGGELAVGGENGLSRYKPD